MLAVVFFLTSLGLTYMATHGSRSGGGVMDAVKDVPVVPGVPGVPNAAAPAPGSARTGPGGGRRCALRCGARYSDRGGGQGFEGERSSEVVEFGFCASAFVVCC